MIQLLFLIGLLVLAFMLYRSGKRGRKLNDAIEQQRDLRNELKIREIEEENDHLASALTGSSDIREESSDTKD